MKKNTVVQFIQRLADRLGVEYNVAENLTVVTAARIAEMLGVK